MQCAGARFERNRRAQCRNPTERWRRLFTELDQKRSGWHLTMKKDLRAVDVINSIAGTCFYEVSEKQVYIWSVHWRHKGSGCDLREIAGLGVLRIQ